MKQRSGILGVYYGSSFNESSSLSNSQMKVNAQYITKFFVLNGWTLNAIAGILGNMQAESSLNPGRWQSENVNNLSGGYGLVQWTPASKYINWCNVEGFSDPSEMDNNLNRILYEMNANEQWIATSEYNFSFKEFSKSTKSAEYLASAFLKCYERAGVEVEETRRNNAREWYEYITGIDIDDPGSTGGSSNSNKKKKFNFIIFNRRRKLS